jgi:hypothetical protein
LQCVNEECGASHVIASGKRSYVIGFGINQILDGRDDHAA